MRDHLEQRLHGQDARPVGQCGLRRVAGRQDKSPSRGAGLQRHGERAAHLAHLAGKRKLARKLVPCERLGRQLPARREHPERDGQVEAARILGQIRRRQIDGDSAGRKLEPGVIQRRTHAVLGLAYLGVRQADDVERRQPGSEMNLDRHFGRVDSGQRAAGDDGKRHESPVARLS